MAEPSSDETRHQITQSTLHSRVTAVIVSVLLVVFFLTTVGNTATILSTVEMVKNDPYPASVAAGHLETRLVQLRTMAVRSVYITTPDAIENMLQIYHDADPDITECISVIEHCDSVRADQVKVLKDGYEELKTHQQTLVELCRDPAVGAAEVHEFVNENLVPVVTTLLNTDLSILDESTRAVENVYQAVNDACRRTIFISCTLIVAVVVSLFVYTAILHRKTKREERLTAELQRTLEVAQSASRAKSTFLSSMSHDIRTPMNAIVGLTTIAENNIGDTERVQSCLERIDTSSRHLLSLINDILDMNEIESGKISLNAEPFSISGLMDDLVAIVQPQARGRGLDLDVSVGPLAHDMVIGDTLRLHQVVLNLASNAVKYSKPDGWVRISVQESPTASPEVNSYLITVEDNGIGMDQDFLECIFEPFERERKETSSFTEGAGLGMSITKNLVDLMGGTISVESQRGVGSRFTVAVPLRVTAATGPCEPESAADQGNLHGRVLLVEDDALNREIAIELIQSFGVEVETACDGVEALDELRAAEPGRYGMIFMDCQMPRMGGLEATEKIREMEQEMGHVHTPIVAMTANAFNEDRKKALRAGMDSFMSKPISMTELGKQLRRYLG